MKQKSIFVKGGAGLVGSHAVLQLLLSGYKAVIVNNLGNSSQVAVDDVQKIASECGPNLSFHQIDLRDKPALE